jgi:hypothetical protein
MTDMPDRMEVQTERIDGVLYAKVRIPVSINRQGEWMADGYWSRKRDAAIREVEEGAAECGFGNVQTHFVYALVPVPDALVLHGEVE